MEQMSAKSKSTNLSIAFGVLEEVKNELDRLDGPTGLGGLERLSLSSATNTTVEAAERNGLIVLLDITEVGESLGKLHAGDGSSNLMGVLELYTTYIVNQMPTKDRLKLKHRYLREHGGKSLLTKQLINRP
jgi:hypothetical protein